MNLFNDVTHIRIVGYFLWLLRIRNIRKIFFKRYAERNFGKICTCRIVHSDALILHCYYSAQNSDQKDCRAPILDKIHKKRTHSVVSDKDRAKSDPKQRIQFSKSSWFFSKTVAIFLLPLVYRGH